MEKMDTILAFLASLLAGFKALVSGPKPTQILGFAWDGVMFFAGVGVTLLIGVFLYFAVVVWSMRDKDITKI